MIGWLHGTVVDKDMGSALIDAKGIGYEVTLPLQTLAKIQEIGESTTLFIHTHVREDDIKLFGFETKNDRTIFQILIKVSGVGPKLALAVLGALSGRELAHVIADSDTRRLSAIPGIGKKTAERMILELGGKLKISDAGETGAPSGMLTELGSALQNLGFKPSQVDRVITEIRGKGLYDAPFEVALRESLSMLKER